MEHEEYVEQYVNEVEQILRYKYKINDIVIVFMIFDLLRMIEDDPVYVFHYDSEYWGNFIAKASGYKPEESKG